MPEGGKTCVRVVCNSCLQPLDVQTARAAKWGMHREWCASLSAEIGAPMKARLQWEYGGIWGRCLQIIQNMVSEEKYCERNNEAMPRGARLDSPGTLHHVIGGLSGTSYKILS